MSTIDKAALIEQAAALAASVYIEAMPKPRAFTKADHRTIAGLIGDDLTAALPVIAKALLAPLRKKHNGLHQCEWAAWWTNDPDYAGQIASRGACPTLRLLDAIEAEVQP